MRLNFRTKYPFDPTRATEFKRKIQEEDKIHTLREDLKQRWRVGMKIEMAQGSRYKPDIFCTKYEVKSIQDVIIICLKSTKTTGTLEITVDSQPLNQYEMRRFWENDGFDNINDFIAWFFPNGGDDAIKLRCIHWTTMKYGPPQYIKPF